MLLFMECNILVPIPCHSLTIIMEVLQLSFCFCCLPDHMVRTKKMLVDVKDYCGTVLCPISLFHVDISIHVCEHLRENLIHQGIVNLERINLLAESGFIQGFFSHLEFQPGMDNGSPGDQLLVKVQVSTISRWLPWCGAKPHWPVGSPLYLSQAWGAALCSPYFHLIFFINFGRLGIFGFLLF